MTTALGQDVSHPDWEMVEAVVSANETALFQAPDDWFTAPNRPTRVVREHATGQFHYCHPLKACPYCDDDDTAWLKRVAVARYLTG